MRRSLIASLLALGLSLSGCSSVAVDATKAEKEETKASQETKSEEKIEANEKPSSQDIKKIERQLKEAKATIKTQKKELAEKDDRIAELEKAGQPKDNKDNSAKAFKDRPTGMLYFPIIRFNESAEEEVIAYAAIKPQAEVENKLTQLTKVTNQVLFPDKEMKFTGLEDHEGQSVAVIDLVGAEDWHQAFQGSVGGGMNSQSLVATFLQKAYTNRWVDGVRFTMDGAPIDLDHAPILSETQFR